MKPNTPKIKTEVTILMKVMIAAQMTVMFHVMTIYWSRQFWWWWFRWWACSIYSGPRNNPNNSYTRAEARRLSKLLNPDLNNNFKIRKFSGFNCPNLISLLTPGKELLGIFDTSQLLKTHILFLMTFNRFYFLRWSKDKQWCLR